MLKGLAIFQVTYGAQKQITVISIIFLFRRCELVLIKFLSFTAIVLLFLEQ